MNRIENLKKLGIILLGILLVILAVYGGFRILKATVFLEDDDAPKTETVSKTIEHDGKKYFPKQDVETILFIGVDGDDEIVANKDSQCGIVAEELMVVILDKTKKQIDFINLDCDIATDIPVLDADGKKSGTEFAKLGRAYSYGDGMETSCMNTIDAVSTLMHGVEIDHFISLNMEALRILSEAADVEFGDDEDMSINDVLYALKDVAESDPSVFLTKYKEISKYLVTDCSITTWGSIFGEYGEFEMNKSIYPDGKNVHGEDGWEYHLDEENFKLIVLKYLFAEKQ